MVIRRGSPTTLPTRALHVVHSQDTHMAYVINKGIGRTTHHGQTTLIGWSPAPQEWLKLTADGTFEAQQTWQLLVGFSSRIYRDFNANMGLVQSIKEALNQDLAVRWFWYLLLL